MGPLSSSYINEDGQPENEAGKFLTSRSPSVLGDRYYGDGTTIVNTKIIGNYVYCGNSSCNAFVGVFNSRNYDPRHRPWYSNVRKTQRGQWSNPYTFFNMQK